MRRTGRTTRIVDDAIQKLFKYGEVIVPLHMDGDFDIRNLDLIVSDPDWIDERIGASRRHVNEEIINKIERRLLQEHRLKIKKGFRWNHVKVTLSDEYVISVDIQK